MSERRVFPLSDDPAMLPSVVMERLERETGKRVVSLTVHCGVISEYEVVLEEEEVG